MPSLKDLRNRIDSVKSTKKITQAMKMVAASKLKKAQSLAEKGRSYSSGLDSIVKGLVNSNKTILIVNKSDLGVEKITEDFKKFNPIYISLKKATKRIVISNNYFFKSSSIDSSSICLVVLAPRS